MWLRVSCGIIIQKNNNKFLLLLRNIAYVTKIFYSQTTLFNSATPRPQMSSCYLFMEDDSIDGIFNTLKDCASISKWAGGIGLHVHNVRSSGSPIQQMV